MQSNIDSENKIITNNETKEEEKEVTIEDETSSSSLNIKKQIKSYKTLSKFNLSLLNGIVTGSTAFICSGGILFSCTIPATIGCLSLAISASSLNQIQEYKYDQLMSRTKLIRPLCTGKLSPKNAKIWSAAALLLGTSTLSIFCGSTSAMIGLSTLILYNFIYTPLKRVTPYNTEFGAIVGALPPQIGIAASHYYSLSLMGSHPSIIDVLNATIHDPLCLYTFCLLYMWQMPHFLYLSIRNKADYVRGGFKMWSADHIGGDALCKKKSMIYASMLLPLPILTSYSNITSFMFAFDGSLLNVFYLMSVYKWYGSSSNDNGQKSGRYSFLFNLIYLPTFLFLMTIHSKRWKYTKGEFFSTHLAYLQDKGIDHCLYDHEKEYEASGLPAYIDGCISPFRNEIHEEKPVQVLTIDDENMIE